MMLEKNCRPPPNPRSNVTFHPVIPFHLAKATALAIPRKFNQRKARRLGMTH